MKARRFIVNLCAAYEALRLFALYLLVSLLFPGEFSAGLGPITLIAAMPAFALITFLIAAGRYAELWGPTFIAYRLYKGLSVPVWVFLLLQLLTGAALEPRSLVALAALAVVDLLSFLLSFLAPQESGETTGAQEEPAQERDDHPRYEEIEVD